MKTVKKLLFIAAISFAANTQAQLVYTPNGAAPQPQAKPAAPTVAGAKPKSKWKKPVSKWYPGCCGVKKWSPKGATTTTTTTVRTMAGLPPYQSVLRANNVGMQAPPPMGLIPVMANPQPMQAAPVAAPQTGENIFPLNGNAGIGTNSPNAGLEIKRSGGDGDNKNYMINLTNVWSPAGLNEPTIIFNNGDVAEKLSYWTMGARVSGDNAHANLPQSFKIGFKPQNDPAEKEYFSIDGFSGNVRIGYCNSNMEGYKLFVEQGILTEKVKVAVKNSDEWFDTVFEPDYKVMPIKDLETFIKTYKHLPEIPTTSDVMSTGLDLGKMNGLLLKKVEELTLYMIDLKKELDETKKQIAELKKP